MSEDTLDKFQAPIVIFIFLIIGCLAIGALFGIAACYQKYNVWSSSLSGQAQLAQADWNRQIIIREAGAKNQSATYLAQAEIKRAAGVAQANKFIGDSLKDNEAYLRYLWIDNLQNEHNQVIYVPTEANLPILEAQRLNDTTGANK